MKLTISAAAKELGVSINTLRRWDKLGILVPEKTPSGHRRYDEKTIKEFYNQNKKEV